MGKLPRQGEVFLGRYEIVSILGEGGFARVYRARDLSLEREVALKVLLPEKSETSDARFLREARMLAGLQDPHTVTLFDFGRSADGQLYMACEFVEGHDLRERLKRERRFTPDIVVHILTQLLMSLQEAHASGLLHRDIKPANILVYEFAGDPYRVKLADFGLVKPLDKDATVITREGAIAGTPRYMAPEQVLAGPVGPATDLYSLGLVAFEMIAGAPAVDGESMGQLLRGHVIGAPFSVPDGICPPELSEIIERMAAREPDERYASASAVLRALKKVRKTARSWSPSRGPASPTTTSPTTTPPSGLERDVGASNAPPASSTSRIAGFAGAAAALIVLVVVAAALFPARDQPQRKSHPIPEEDSTTPDLTASQPARAPADEPDATPRRDVGTDAGDTGCGSTVDGLGLRRLASATSILGSADAQLYVPGSYEPDKPHPLLMLVPSATQTILADTRFEETAERHGFLILIPYAKAPINAWETANDLDRLRDLVRRVRAEYCIAPDRIFALGHGDGGEVVEEMACTFEEVDAIATMATAWQPGRSHCERAIPFLRLAPLKDGYNPVDGGKACSGVVKMSLAEHDEMWRGINGCEGDRRVERQDDGGTCYTWDCETPFVTCHLDGGRGFPFSGERLFDIKNCDGEPADFAFRQTIWEFFDTLNGPPADPATDPG